MYRQGIKSFVILLLLLFNIYSTNSENEFSREDLLINSKKIEIKHEFEIADTEQLNQRIKDSVFTWSNSIPAAEAVKFKGNTFKKLAPLSIVDNLPQPPVQGETHWVIPGSILAGSSPGEMTEPELLSIVNSGIDTFLNLQISYLEYVNFDYRTKLQNMALLNKQKFPPHQLDFLHYPIGDYSTVLDNEMWDLVEELKTLLEIDNRNIYIHCYGGHGRTGLVLVNLLQSLFEVSKDSAMEVLRKSHKTRECDWNYCSLSNGKLESSAQEEQARRLEKIFIKKRKLKTPLNNAD